jgi:predicted ABC-type ATPase
VAWGRSWPVENGADAELHFVPENPYETVLSTDKYRRQVLAAKKKQFEFRLIYVVLASPDLNVAHVRLRVKKPGHDAPEAKIRERWFRSFRQLPKFPEQADRAWMFDNSGAAARQIGLKQDGNVIVDPAAPATLREAIELVRNAGLS